MIQKVISGGQSGADFIGLESARLLRIPTGGTAPKGYKTEKGRDERLREFGLIESDSDDYAERTKANVSEADFTVLFGDMRSPGSRLTITVLKALKKPYLANPTADQLYHKLLAHNVKILNVAGNRASKLSKDQMVNIADVLVDALQKYREFFMKCGKLIDEIHSRISTNTIAGHLQAGTGDLNIPPDVITHFKAQGYNWPQDGDFVTW